MDQYHNKAGQDNSSQYYDTHLELSRIKKNAGKILSFML